MTGDKRGRQSALKGRTNLYRSIKLNDEENFLSESVFHTHLIVRGSIVNIWMNL
jgi:hypothetical protein